MQFAPGKEGLGQGVVTALTAVGEPSPGLGLAGGVLGLAVRLGLQVRALRALISDIAHAATEGFTRFKECHSF